MTVLQGGRWEGGQWVGRSSMAGRVLQSTGQNSRDPRELSLNPGWCESRGPIQRAFDIWSLGGDIKATQGSKILSRYSHSWPQTEDGHNCLAHQVPGSRSSQQAGVFSARCCVGMSGHELQDCSQDGERLYLKWGLSLLSISSSPRQLGEVN